MSTYSYSAVINHTTDAGFRAWGSGLSAGLALCGLTQTADTGQINWSTVLKPAQGAAAGYEIWRNIDNSIYIKLEYGSNSNSATYPSLWITVGTGSNGTGTITGQTSGRLKLATDDTTIVSTSTPYANYLSSSAGHITIWFGVRSLASNNGDLVILNIQRIVDSTGNPGTEGFCLFYIALGDSNSTYQLMSVRTTAIPATYNLTSYNTIIPGTPAASEPAGSNQFWPTWGNLPNMRVNAGAIVYINSEIAKENTFPATPVGTVEHTYIAVGTNGASIPWASAPAGYALALRYD